jgi:hypothetical protein
VAVVQARRKANVAPSRPIPESHGNHADSNRPALHGEHTRDALSIAEPRTSVLRFIEAIPEALLRVQHDERTTIRNAHPVMRMPEMLREERCRAMILLLRSESEVWSELSALCRSNGYLHALAFLCFRDNVIRCTEEIRADDIANLCSAGRLIRTEISCLIGLMIQGDVNCTLPPPEIVQQYIHRTDSLLEEIHHTLLPPVGTILPNESGSIDPSYNPFTKGDWLREAIFYSGESAYSFQYCDFASLKYGSDDAWLLANRGFSIEAARQVVRAVSRLQEQTLISAMDRMAAAPPTEWSLLPGFMFTLDEVVNASGVEAPVVTAVSTPSLSSRMKRTFSFVV